MSSDFDSEKKKALLAYKQKLLNDIHNCEKRIDIANRNHTQAFYEDEESSDSDSGFPIPAELGPSTKQLKTQRSSLSVCLQATQELTGLNVLESEVVVLIKPPTIKKGPAPTSDGLWREVTAECRVDLVPFSIMFYIHQPSAKFAPATYHDLQVTAVKAAHSKELAKSALVHASRPSDAVQILRSFSAAHRSRRTTLARLAEKYAEALFMEALPKGGYTLKCANLLEISWTLTNKLSPIAPFHHRLKFDIEYMDEAYIKTIKKAHKLLMDPSLETNERTELLTNIIDTCLEANGGISSVQDSDFDPPISPIKDTNRISKRQITGILDEEPLPKKVKDSEVMAPPKSFPKRIKRASDIKSDSVETQENITKKDNLAAKKNNLVKKGEVKKATAVSKTNEVVEKQGDDVNTVQNKEGKSLKAKNIGNNDKMIKNEKAVTNKNANTKKNDNKVAKQNSDVKKIVIKKTETDKVIKVDNENNKNVANVSRAVDKEKAINLEEAKKVNNTSKSADGNQPKSLSKKIQNVDNEANKISKPRETTENINKISKSAKVVTDIEQKKVSSTKKVLSDTNILTKKTSKFSMPTNENSAKVIKNPNTDGKVVKIIKNTDKIISSQKTTDVDKKKNVLKATSVQKTIEKVKTKIPLPQSAIRKPDALSGNNKKNILPIKTKIPQKMPSANDNLKTFQNPVRMSPRTIKKSSTKTSSMFTL